MGGEHLVDGREDLADAQLRRLADRGREIAPEPREHVAIAPRAGRDVVELALEVGGEVVFDIAAEVVGEERRHQPPLVLGDEAVLLLADIVALNQRREDRGIGRGAPDPEFLHPLDEGCLGIAGRGFGEVLLGRHGAPLDALARRHLRQARGVLVALVVAPFLVELEEAVKQHDLPRGAQAHLAVGAEDLGRGALEPRGLHLAGDAALPDQLIEAALVGVGDAQPVGGGLHVGRADALMRFLRVLGLVLVDAGGVGDIGGAEAAPDLGAGGRDGLGRHVDAVGAHVGDVAGLIEALGGRHAGLGAHAELAARLLLERRGHEGGRGIARDGLGLDRIDPEGARGDGGDRHLGRGRVRDVELAQHLAGEAGKPRGEGLAARRGHQRAHGPVFARPEGLDLHLALDHEAQADRLHAAGRFRAGQLAPEHGREGEAHEIIERAARQIGIDQRCVDLARVGHRLGDGGFRDRVEGHPLDLLAALERWCEGLAQVPADRLALAVGVGGEDEVVVGLERLGDGADMLAAVGVDLPLHRETRIGVDRAVLGGQVADMAVGGEDRVVGPEILVDRLCLGGRFDDDDGHRGSFRGRNGKAAEHWPVQEDCQSGRTIA